ncbi:DNA methyltransferase [Paenibacillus sp. FSL R7-0179]|uniref:DNA methyltransferase n=1 Tax=Paenibacillus sp. FSL R7-0179 TaxID=2921672 RepID=UPI0030FBFC2A
MLDKTLLERNLPIKLISDLALKEGNSKKPVYTIHKWWARRLGSVVRSILIGATLPHNASDEEFWKHYYSKNTLDITVLDPFMGGGTTLVESKKMAAKTIGVDIDPLACFITRKELECMNVNLDMELEHLEETVGREIQEMYTTTVQGSKYPIINVFWVYELNCPNCNLNIHTHPHYKLNSDKKKKDVFCKCCGEIHVVDNHTNEFICNTCQTKTEIEKGVYKRGYCVCPNCSTKFEFAKTISENKRYKMFALEYENKGQRFFKKTTIEDEELYSTAMKKSEKILDKYYVPQNKIPSDNRTDPRPISHGYLYYKDLFNSRQLFSLAILFDEILKIKDRNFREWLLIAFSDSLASNNMLCNYAYGYRKLTPLFGIHAYTVPVRPVENNVWGAPTFGRGSFKKCLNKVMKAKDYCNEVYESNYLNGNLQKTVTGEKISSVVTNNSKIFYNNLADSLIINQSSENLDQVLDNSVDLVLTDPPYYDNLHYSELADFYYQWIKAQISDNKQNPLSQSLFVHDTSDETHSNYENKLTNIFKQCHKKLNESGMMIFSYHHNKELAWLAMGKAIKKAEFEITNIIPIRSEGNSGYHTNENSIKWDSIIIMRKKSMNNDRWKGSLHTLVEFWKEYFVMESLDLKECDKLSFFRSLAVQVFSTSNSDLIKDLELVKKMI